MGRFSRAVVDRAAGGVVCRQGPDEPEILLVHRSRYDDWALPKGHVDDGESWTETARREVLEETGVRAQVSGAAVPVSYTLPGTGSDPGSGDEVVKIVVFYPMQVLEEGCGTPDPDEVDAVEWVPVGSCPEKMSYADEVQILVRMGLA